MLVCDTPNKHWRGGRVVMQRPAKPCTPVRFRPPPPMRQNGARVVKLVDTADLKSAAYLNKGRAGSIPAPGTNKQIKPA